MSPLAAARYDETVGQRQPSLPPLDSPDWLTLQQAACELGVSPSTVRRMVRGGKLLNRMVPHRGGFAYLVYIPASRHGTLRAAHKPRRRLWFVKGDTDSRGDVEAVQDPQETILSLERQVEQLSHALSRALRAKQLALPAGMGEPGANDSSPYARYRWLRRRRWWPF